MERERLAGLERERLAGLERERLAGLERERLAGLKRQRLAGLKRQRLAGLGRERLAGLKRQRLARSGRQRLAGWERVAGLGRRRVDCGTGGAPVWHAGKPAGARRSMKDRIRRLWTTRGYPQGTFEEAQVTAFRLFRKRKQRRPLGEARRCGERRVSALGRHRLLGGGGGG
ncbi:hypothetical protein ACQPZJ_10955 [Actinoplanes sp. CA-054009]